MIKRIKLWINLTKKRIQEKESLDLSSENRLNTFPVSKYGKLVWVTRKLNS